MLGDIQKKPSGRQCFSCVTTRLADDGMQRAWYFFICKDHYFQCEQFGVQCTVDGNNALQGFVDYGPGPSDVIWPDAARGASRTPIVNQNQNRTNDQGFLTDSVCVLPSKEALHLRFDH